MTYMEQHIVDHCHTAADVILAAQLVRQRRAALWTKIERKLSIPIIKTPTLDELVRQADALMNSIDVELKKMGISSEQISDPKPSDIKISDIHKYVARKWDITVSALQSDRRSKEFVIPRQVSFLLARELSKKSYPEIGRRTGDRDHTTVIHGIRKFEWLRQKLLAELTIESPLSAWVNRAYELVKEHVGA